MFTVLTLALAADAAPQPSYEQTVSRVEQMTWDTQAQALVRRHGLGLMNVTWEDTGRTKGSVWGPNISDMTIGVRDRDGRLHPMPVIRFDNFSDETADIRSDRFWLRVGNHDTSGPMHTASLEEVLRNTERYLSLTDGDIEGSLWAPRDEHVLVSAQAAFLPIPTGGEATFTPVLYNYQSSPGNPAVLTIVATREGTSIQVVDNDGGYLSEVLYFNDNGQRAPFTAVRRSDHRASGTGANGSVSAAGEDGLNVVLVVQVPLKFEARPNRGMLESFGYVLDGAPMAAAGEGRSDVEQAVVGHGPVEGPFEELAGLTVERDPTFPVRVTVQFYQATSNGIVSDDDVARLRAQIDRVYENGDYVGSLVTTGPTGRPTEWTDKPRPPVWAGTWSTGFHP